MIVKNTSYTRKDLDAYLEQAREMRSQEVARLVGKLFHAPRRVTEQVAEQVGTKTSSAASSHA